MKVGEYRLPEPMYINLSQKINKLTLIKMKTK
jgi:hypothetical protein